MTGFSATKFSAVMTALALLAVLAIPGCGRRQVTVSFPLDRDLRWVYSGVYTSKVASAEIKLPVSNHVLAVEGVESAGGFTYMNAAISIEGSIYSRFLLRKADGKIFCRDGDRDILLFPGTIKLGDKWDVSFMGRALTLEAKMIEEIKVPAGNYQALRIAFRDREKLEGSLWCADQVGIVALDFRESDARPARAVRLELKEFGKGGKVSFRESR